MPYHRRELPYTSDWAYACLTRSDVEVMEAWAEQRVYGMTLETYQTAIRLVRKYLLETDEQFLP